jgi:hypothetical protein
MNSTEMIKRGYREAKAPRLKATTVTLHIDQVGIDGTVGDVLRRHYVPVPGRSDKLGRW